MKAVLESRSATPPVHRGRVKDSLDAGGIDAALRFVFMCRQRHVVASAPAKVMDDGGHCSTRSRAGRCEQRYSF